MNNVTSLVDYKQNIKFDGSLPIAAGKNRMEKHWKNKTMTWSSLLKRLETVTRTTETYREYMAMPKAEQDQIKDVGGFIGGSLKDGRRKAENVQVRQLVTLDADFAPPGLDEDLEMLATYAYAVYSTHKHTPAKPRLRILIPLDRPVTPDEYEAISRKLAEDIGIDYFDDTTYQASRMMYWPSVSQDGEYLFHYEDLPWLEADRILARYPDWTDTSYWPESSRTRSERMKGAKKQGDPTEKTGLVGAFCRTYTVEEAMEKFLPGVYEKCSIPDRYTYTEGSTAAGLVIYDNGKFAYSNHATDPAGGKLCNAFDLVRIHKFGALDEEAAPGTTGTKLPSYKAMIELALKDEETGISIGEDNLRQAKQDFGEVSDAKAWLGKLSRKKNGACEDTIENIRLILNNDDRIKDCCGYDMFSNRLTVLRALPWREIDSTDNYWKDADDSGLRNFIEKNWGIDSMRKISDALEIIQNDNKFHPVRDYLDGLKWDGVPRLETLYIDYLGADDTRYTRMVARKMFVAGVARIYQPGTKFDEMTVFAGAQGVGKSTFIRKMSKGWYKDDIVDFSSKDTMEGIQGNWLIEVAELDAMYRSEIEQVKSFLSKQVDKFRPAYARRSTERPRQCLFFGTTNNFNFLKDRTGGRRFWPIEIHKGQNTKNIFTNLDGDVDQIWAEAKYLYQKEEQISLNQEEEAMADEVRKSYMEDDGRSGMIEEYLNMKYPKAWDTMNLRERQNYIHETRYNFGEAEDGFVKDKVCVAEIYCELFKGDVNNRSTGEAKAISAILNNLTDWERASTARFGPLYGTQKCYRRVNRLK